MISHRTRTKTKNSNKTNGTEEQWKKKTKQKKDRDGYNRTGTKHNRKNRTKNNINEGDE